MIISAKIIEHPRKVRDCEVCKTPINFRQLRLYGSAESDKPYVIYTHVDCGNWDKNVERKLHSPSVQADEDCLHTNTARVWGIGLHCVDCGVDV